MALSLEQQQRLASLQQKGPAVESQPIPQQSGGLNPEQQSRLAVLQQMGQQPSPNNSLDLIQSLSGRLPSQGALPSQTAQAFGTTFRDVGFKRRGRPVENPEFKKEVDRREAFAELSKKYDPEQIQTVLDIQKRVDPGILRSLKNNAGQTVGGIGGAAIGTKIALAAGQIPPFTALPEELITVPLFAGAGAFLGGGGGKVAQQAIDPLESPSARDFLKSGSEEAAFEVGGRLLKPIARGVGFGKKSSEAVEVAKKRFGLEEGFFQPGQRDPRALVRAADQLATGSFGGGPVMASHNIAQQGQALEIGQDIIKKIAGGAVEDPDVLGSELAGIFTRLGEKGQKTRGVRQTLLDTFFDDLYKQVDELSPGAEFTTAPLKKMAKARLEKDISQGGALLTSEGRSRLNGIVNTLDNVKSADDMRQLRSLYVKDARRFQIAGDQSSVVFSDLAEAADDILFDEGSQAGLTEPARKLLRNINTVYGPGKQLYDEEIVKEVVRKLNTKPGLVNTLIGKNPDPKRLRNIKEILINPVRATSGSGKSAKTVATELRSLKGTLKNPAAIDLVNKNTAEGKRLWRQLKANWFQENIINPKTGLVDAARMDKAIKTMDPKSFRQLFPGELGKDVKALNGLVDTISPKKGGLASLFGKGIEFSGAGAVGSGLSLGDGMRVVKGGLLSIGPAMYARIATNPKATKLLTLGLKQQIANKAVNVPAFAARLIKIMSEEDASDQKAMIKQRDRILGQAKGRRVEGLRKQALQLGARDE